jgi:hypothetical protein
VDRAESMQLVVEEVSTELHLVPPFSSDDAFRAIERSWHLPILAQPFMRETCPLAEFSTGGCGFAGDTFVIYYYAGGGWVQQERIKFHELGHLLLGHVRKGSGTLFRHGSISSSAEMLAESFAEQMALFALCGKPPTPWERHSLDYPQDPLTRWHQRIGS